MLRLQLARRVVVGTIVGFVALVLVAMRAYPGGTSWNTSARGHDFWLNFLCDLARPTALNGVPNPCGSAFAQAAMLALAVGILAWWPLVARFVPAHPRSARAMRVLGSAGAIGIALVVALPGDRFGRLHGIACVVAGVPGLAAAVLAVAALFRDDAAPRAVRWVGAATLGVSAACFLLYLPDVLSLGSALTMVAVLERLSVMLLLVWMLTGALLRDRTKVEPRTSDEGPRAA